MFKEIFSINDDLDSEFVIEYDEGKGVFRISYFEGGHFVDECRVFENVFREVLKNAEERKYDNEDI